MVGGTYKPKLENKRNQTVVLDVDSIYTPRGRKERRTLHQSPTKSSTPNRSPTKVQAQKGMAENIGTSDDFEIPLEPLAPRQSKVQVSFSAFCVCWKSFQDQHAYMREFIDKRDLYLNRLMLQEAPPQSRSCSHCQGEGSWRCSDCLGQPLFCMACCRDKHTLLPLHRVQQWTGSFFEDSWLRNVGLVLHLGHQGHPCPMYSGM